MMAKADGNTRFQGVALSPADPWRKCWRCGVEYLGHSMCPDCKTENAPDAEEETAMPDHPSTERAGVAPSRCCICRAPRAEWSYGGQAPLCRHCWQTATSSGKPVQPRVLPER